MQESRLFKIVYYLLDKGRATAPELAEKFEVSVRTIYRDIDALSGAGIPVYAEAGRNGGISLMDHFVLDKAILSGEEKQEVLALLQSLHTMRDTDGDRTLQKLSALFQADAESWLEVDFSGWGSQEYHNRKFNRLKSAVIHCKNVKILYAGSCREVRERVIQPLRLLYKSRAWYVKAYCTEKQDYRLFRLSRILELEVLDESFSRRAVPEQTDTSARIYREIVLRFPPEAANRVCDEFDAAQIQRQENGDFIVTAQMPEDGWLTGFLLSFGMQVDIIEPAGLRAVVAEQARRIYEKNRV